MYSLIVSILGGILVALIFGIATPWIGLGIFIGFIIAVAAFFFLTRYFTQQLQNIFLRANGEIQKQRIEQAMEILRTAYRFNNWAFLVKAQIDSQIGIILYTQKKFGEAYKFLKNSNPRIYIGYAMLAIGHLKNGKPEEAKKALDLLIQFNKKEAFVYSLTAYIYEEELHNREKALEYLQKGAKKLPHNQNLNEHLIAMQNKSSFKMDKYGEVWYQMYLDKKAISRLQQQTVRDAQKRMKNRAIIR